MGRFYPLYIRRSDGKLDITTKGKKEANAPTKEQLDQTPDKSGVSDFYREIQHDEAKHLDWRRKLGGMLARELENKDKASSSNAYILAALPENYRLYEHVKRTEKDEKVDVKSKTQIAAGPDRQDAYLYGHPAGKRKRFRSPNDFFPHVLWLCTDEAGDPDNCACKLCCPEDMEMIAPSAKVKTEKADRADVEHADKDVKTKPENPGPEHAQNPPQVPTNTQTSAAATQVAAKTPTSQRPLVTQPNQPSTVLQPAQAQPSQQAPSPLPPPATRDQQIDRQYRGFMYRPGELVWFQRGQAWGLGVVLRRSIAHQVQFHYEVQPLSYPNHVQASVRKTNHTEMRPWLAWSVPKYTNDGLNQTTFTYQDANWPGILGKQYGHGDMEVDASILAAKAIDCSYSVFDELETLQPEPGVTEKRYRGAFVGAEKIWLGEPVRLAGGSNTDVMIVQQIIEQTRSNSSTRTIQFGGDVFRLATVAHANPALPSPAAPRSNTHLPIRMTEDLAVRNARSINVKQVASYWGAIAYRTRVDLQQVKGRWYEASILLPILLPQFEEMMSKGEVSEASLWMNARGDCLNTNRPADVPRIARVTTRHANRREALGRAVPPNVQIHDTTEGTT